MENPTPEQIKEFITAGMECTYIEVNGDGRHFYATIVSPSFVGQRTIARQRAVYATLGERILGSDAPIHALSMKTYTPDEWLADQAR